VHRLLNGEDFDTNWANLQAQPALPTVLPRWGISPENTYSLAEVTADIKATPKLVQMFNFQIGGDGASFPTAVCQSIQATGAIPMLVTQPEEGTACLDNVINGNDDAFLTAWATTAAKVGGTIIWRPFREMNLPASSNWCPALYATNNSITLAAAAAKFIAAWQHMYSIVKPIAPNVKMCWCLAGSGTIDANHCPYPGDSFVDYPSFDGYNKTVGTNKTWATLTSSVYSFITGVTALPIIVAEMGCIEFNLNDKAAWIFTNLQYVAASQPQVQCVVYFNGTGAGDYTLETSTTAVAAFTAIVTFPPYLS
jgi:hypothetical protein